MICVDIDYINSVMIDTISIKLFVLMSEGIGGNVRLLSGLFGIQIMKGKEWKLNREWVIVLL